MAYRPPYGSQPPGAFSASPQPVRPGGAGGVQSPRQQQFGMGMPQAQSFQMMPQPPSAVPGGGMVPQMFPGQPAGIYPGTGYSQTPVQPVYMGQPGMVHPGMVQPGLVGRGVEAPGMVPGMGPRLPQNMTAEQQKKFAEKQKKLAEEQKKKEEQERKERYREEQKRKLKEFSTGGRSSLGSKSLDMGELLSKGLMTSPSNQGPHPATAPGIPYQYGMQAPAQAGFVPHSQTVGMVPMMPGCVMVARQPLQPAASATHPLTHSQSLDDGFSGFQKAAPPSTSLTPISSDQTEGDDFGDFLQAPSKPAPTTPSQQPPMQPGMTTPVAAQSQTPPKKNDDHDDDGFGDFLGGPSPSPHGKASGQQETTENQFPVAQSSGTPQDEGNSMPNTKKPGGKSLESMLMQSTDLSESQKERKRFNQKPSLNEVKGHGGSSPRSASTFTPSVKARQWKESEDLSSLFTLPGAEPSQQASVVPGVGGGTAVVGVGQIGLTGQVNPPVAPLPAQQPSGAIHPPAWLQNESALPTVYRQVLEASVREGSIDTSLLYPIFLLSGLDRNLLGHIWSMVNLTMPGQLIPQELFMALALIAQAQKGQEISLPALCTLSEAPVPNLSPQNPAQQPALQQLSSSAPPQPPVASQPQTTSGDDDDFAPFQGAPSVPSVAAEADMPPAPSILSAMTSSAETSAVAGKKGASSGTLSSLIIPAVSTSSSRHSASPASFTQEENCYIFANSPAPSSGRSSPFIWDQNTIYDKLTTRSYDSASSSSLSDHTPTEGDDEDESFDDFKSAPSDSMHRDLDLIPQPIPTLPGPGQKASSSVSAGAAHIPALVPPREKTGGIFAAIPPPPQGTKGGSVAVRAFGSEEQLRADNDFGDFGDFKAAGSDSKTSLSSAAKPGSILGSQPFKHSASESNLQGMQSKTANDRYAALRDLGVSLFDTEPVALPPPAVGGTDDDEFADFQQAGGTLPGIPVASAGEAASFTSPANQAALFESFSARDQPQQPSQGFAAFSPPRESSDWAEAAKKDKDQKASSPHEEEFEGFFSSRSKDGGSGRDTKNNAEESSDTFEKYSSLAGLHAFVTDKPDPVIPSQDSSFGDFQTGTTKAPLQKPSTILPGVGVVAQPTTSSTDFFRLTPPPMTSPSPSSEEAPEDDRFNALRDLSVVDPFEQVGSATQQGSMDGTGSDFYQTHFETIDPTPKGVSKQGLSLGDGMNADSLQSKTHKLELTLDTPVSTTNKAFPIGSINELDLKNFDLKLTIDSKSKEGADEPRERGDSFGDFTAAPSTEPPPLSKGNTMALLPSSGHPPPAAVKPDTTLFGDRYSEVAGDSSDEGRHASEWEKCLSKCYEVMSKANSIFNNISSSSVCSEVIGSAAGIDYLTGVIEVYRVACRITTSIQGLGIDNDILGKLEKDINQIWNNLSAFLQLSSIKPNEGSFVFKTAMLRPEPSNTPQACGVCLLNVDSRSKAFDRSEDSHKLSYGGRQYHATCANLWVNMVDSILPALPLNTLL
ncbi:synergin gamma-like [Diadema antillarum]|uniref:synergin gamma-like n=1 Tax=Diadema antillarum TaxID=105358 RepID=UPI003A89E8CA